jgi:hypothetical protein
VGGIWTATSNFTKGELDPLLIGRVDLEAFYQGVREATNVLAIPQGGLKKRPGMEYLGESYGDGRLEGFSFNTEQNYLMVFTNLRMQVYKDGVLQTNINGSGNDWLDVPWTTAQIKAFDYIQSADTIIITQENVEPRIIQRVNDTNWTISVAPITNIPQYDFNDASSPPPASEVQRITFDQAFDGDRFKISLEGVLTDEIVLNVQSSSSTEENIRQGLLALPNTGNSGVSVSYVAASVYTYEVTFSGDSANDWEEMTGTGVYTKSTNFGISSSTISSGASRAEDVWSSTRGWPRTCTFHESRLWFGGSLSRPSTLWGSRVNDLFNFDKGRARDDEGIDVTLFTDQVNSINGIISNKALQIFTSGAEFYMPESPVTPSNVAIKAQTNLGSKRVRPVSLEGVTLFLQRTGRALYQFQFLNDFQSNESRSVSLLAPHLINDPVQMSVSRGSTETDANYVYLVSSDGNLTVFNTQILEGVQAFTNWKTQGDIKSCAVVSDEIYTLVNRSIDGSSVYYVERENLSMNTDAAVISTVNGDTLTGLDHLEGETVKVKADGAVQSDQIVSGGSISISRVASVIEAGLEYQPRIQTMPFNLQLKNGPNAAQKKRIMRCAVQIYESNGVVINDQQLSDRSTGVNQFDAPIPQTGFKRIYLSGWSLEASIVISQSTPMPMTVLALDLEVKV